MRCRVELPTTALTRQQPRVEPRPYKPNTPSHLQEWHGEHSIGDPAPQSVRPHADVCSRLHVVEEVRPQSGCGDAATVLSLLRWSIIVSLDGHRSSPMHLEIRPCGNRI